LYFQTEAVSFSPLRQLLAALKPPVVLIPELCLETFSIVNPQKVIRLEAVHQLVGGVQVSGHEPERAVK
jgi:hypothetical protein